MRPALALAASWLTLAAAAPAPRERGATIERDRYLMGTLCQTIVEARDSAHAERAAAGALDEIARLERVMTSWRASSELQSLNRAGRARVCSPDLFAVLDSASAYAGKTNGRFDPTVEPLMIAWDLRGAGRVPNERQLAEARAKVGWRRLDLDRGRRTARLEDGAALDLGGIGKGFALDRAAERLRAAGAEAALLNFGGELLACGRREGNWPIAIAHPARRMRPVVTLEVQRGAVSTSAQSERGFTLRGHRYGHVLDPRTGLPVESRASVTVVAASATRADAVSTALLVGGRDFAQLWARRHPEDGVLWLEPAGSAVRMWSWNVRPRPVRGARVIRMNPSRDPLDAPP